MNLQMMAGAMSIALVASSAAGAQDVADKTCKRPELREQVSVSAEQMNYLTESAQSYLDCMKPVIDAKRKRAQETLQSGQAQAQDANAAVTEVNAFIEAFRSYQAKHKDDK